MDVVNIINKQVVTDTIKSLKETNAILHLRIDDYRIDVNRKCDEINDLEDKIDRYETSLDDIVETYFNDEHIVDWSHNGGHYDCGDGLTYNLDKYHQNFENWYSRAKQNFINWVVRDKYENFTSIPNTWVYDVMKWEREEGLGDLNYVQKKNNYDDFIKYVLGRKLKIYLDENDNNFKNKMKFFHSIILEEDEDAEYDD